jgi:hypothetical protein
MSGKVEGGAGKYDELAELVLDRTGAVVVALLVLGGDEGSGFSVSGRGAEAIEVAASGELSAMLRGLADAVESREPDGVRITRESSGN